MTALQPPYKRLSDHAFAITPRGERLIRLAKRRMASGDTPGGAVTVLLSEYSDPDVWLWRSFLLAELQQELA